LIVYFSRPELWASHIRPFQNTGGVARSLQRSYWDVKFFKIKQYTENLHTAGVEKKEKYILTTTRKLDN
jgi:hypothetical protein